MTNEQIVETYVRVARPLILSMFPPNSCIASVRVTKECLEHLGIPVEPLAVKFVAQSKSLKLAYVSGLDPAELAQAEARASKFGKLDAAAPWDGHLVAIAGSGSGRWLIDPCFDAMAAHPAISMAPEMLTAKLPEGLTFGSLEGVVEISGHEFRIQYTASGRRDFEQTPAWETDHLEPLILVILGAMQAANPLKTRS